MLENYLQDLGTSAGWDLCRAVFLLLPVNTRLVAAPATLVYARLEENEHSSGLNLLNLCTFVPALRCAWKRWIVGHSASRVWKPPRIVLDLNLDVTGMDASPT